MREGLDSRLRPCRQGPPRSAEIPFARDALDSLLQDNLSGERALQSVESLSRVSHFQVVELTSNNTNLGALLA